MKRETDLLNLISTYITSWLDKPFKFSGPAILLALFFASCEEPLEAPSSKLVPNDNNTNLGYIELPLNVSQAAFDTSIVSSNNVNGADGIIYVGHNIDDQIGETNLSAYAGLSLESGFNRDSISQSASVVNTRLILRFSYLYGTDFERTQTFRVNRLAEPISQNSRSYKLSDTIQVGEKISIDNDLVVDPNLFLNSEATDSLVVPLNINFGKAIIGAVSNQDLSASELSEVLRGIKISIENKLNTIEGINLQSGQSYLELAFQNPGGQSDTLKMNLTSTSFTHLDFENGSLIPSNYSENKHFNLLDDSKVFFNDVLGIYPRVNLDNYLNFIDSLRFLKINYGELIVGEDLTVINNGTDQVRPPSLIFPYFISESNILKKGEDFWGIQSNFNSNGGLSDQNTAFNLLALSFKESESKISGDVSLFLQEVFDNRDFWDEERSILLNGQFINRNSEPFDPRATFTIGNYNNFLINSDDIKLRIYYTTFEN